MALFVVVIARQESDHARLSRARQMMDTYFTIIAYGDSAEIEPVIDRAFSRIAAIEGFASIYDSGAEAFILNQTGKIAEADPELIGIIERANNVSHLTDSAFDITVNPILKLWKLGLWQKPDVQQAQEIKALLPLVGSDMITIDGKSINFQREGMSICLGGIAKGYAVDAALSVLKAGGVTSALVNGGGDIAVIGLKPEYEPWLIEMENPDDRLEKLASFKVVGVAVATSGNYERYFDPQKKAHHIIDPRSGFPAQGCISVSIIAENCEMADALATAVFVLGVDDGLALIERLDGVEGMIVDEAREIHHSGGMSQYEAGE